jgi:hypothetical protein
MNRKYYYCTSDYTPETLSQINNLFKLNSDLNSIEILNKNIHYNRKVKDWFLHNFPYSLKSTYSSFLEKKIPFFTLVNRYSSFLSGINYFENSWSDSTAFSEISDELNNLFLLNSETYSQQDLIKCFLFKQNNQEQTFDINIFDYSLKQISSYNDKPVFSVFSKNIYDAANIANPDYFTEEIISNTSFRTYKLNNSFTRTINSKNKKFDILNLLNFAFDFDLTSYLDSINSSRLQVLKVPSWSARSKDKEIEFTSYTKNQALKRKTCLIPVLFKMKYLDSSLNEKDCYIFSFISNALINEVENRKNPKARFKDLINILFDYDGLKLTNIEEYNKLVAEKLKSLAAFSSTHLEEIPSHLIDTLLLITNPEYEPFSKKINSSILNKPKIDFKLEQKFNKFKTLIENNQSNIKSIDLATNLSSLRRNKASLLFLAKEIKKAIDRIDIEKKSLVENFQTISDSFNYISSNYPLYNQVKSNYNSALALSYENQNFETNDFLNNLTKENIFIHSIEYYSQNYNFDLTTKNFDNLSDQDKIDFYTNVSKNYYKIKQVTFLLNCPAEIKVVDKNQSIFGGPYLIQVTQNRLKVKLAYNSSLFGYNSSNAYYYIHPHTGGTSNIDTLFEWSNACLGEASPLIYNAFQQNDLKLILLSALTWVRSANSADPWGSNYIYFSNELKPLSLKLESEEEIVTNTDVNNFLSSFTEEDSEESQDIPDQPEQNNLQEDQINNNNYVPFATYNTLNET